MEIVARDCRPRCRRRWRSPCRSCGGAPHRVGVSSFVSKYGFDAAVYVEAPLPAGTKWPAEVASVTTVAGLDNGQPTCRVH